jgi:Sap, sulfolipid-1-addressing protein
MGNLLTRTTPLAFGAALSPTMLVVVFLMLAGPVHPRRRAAAFGLGAGLVLVLVGAAVLVFMRRSIVHDRHLYDWADIALALAAAVVAVRQLVVPPTPHRGVPGTGAGRGGVERSFLLGAAMMGTNFSTLVLYVAAMKDTAAARVEVSAKAGVIVFVFVVTSAMLWVPLLFAAPASRIAGEWVGPIDAFARRHARPISVAVPGLFAIFLLVKGARGLS